MSKKDTKGHGKKSKKDEDSDDDDDAEETTPDHGTKNVSAALEALDDEDWAETEEQGFGDVPDGKYQVKIKSATINNAKSSGRLQVSWDLIIVGDADGTKSEMNGRHIFKHDGINNSDARGWFKSGLARLGVTWPKSAKGLPKVLDDLKDTYAEVNCKTKEDSEFQNTHFNRALDESEVASADADEDATDEDDDEEVEEKKPKKKDKKKKDEPEDDDDDVEDDDADEEPKSKKKKKDEDEDDDEDEADDDDDKKEDDDDADDDDEDDEPEEKPKAKKDKGKAKDEPKVDIKFDEDDLDEDQQKQIKKMAKKDDFDPSDYKSVSEMLGDVAEYNGISGEFASAKKLIRAVAEAQAK